MPEFAYGSGPPVPVGAIRLERINEGITLVKPLSRRGYGPGIILLVPNDERATPVDIEDGIPSLRMKWAEEGYAVAEITASAINSEKGLETAIKALDDCKECEPKEKLGVVCYNAEMWTQAATAMESSKDRIVAAALYAETSQFSNLASQTSIPTVYHLTGKSETKINAAKECKVYEYATTSASAFPMPFHEHFHYATEAVSHTRNLTFLKSRMGGPYFDLELLWDEHTYYEFGDRNVENTMATMVEEPYVNHIPTVSYFSFFFISECGGCKIQRRMGR